MNELLSASLWPRIRKLAKSARRKQAAIAYVTDDRFIKFSEGDVLVTDASDAAIKAGQTDAQLLKRAFERNAELFSLKGLHGKVYVFDRHAIVGSANLSKGSENLTEVATLTDNPSVLGSARILIGDLSNRAKSIDESFIKRICKLPVTKQPSPSGRKKAGRRELDKPRIWLVGLKPRKEKKNVADAVKKGKAKAERRRSNPKSDVGELYFGGSSLFRKEAKKDDLIIRIWTENAKGKPDCVYHHSPILNREEDKEAGETVFFVEDYPDCETTSLTWAEFKKLYGRAGIKRKLTQWPTREIRQQQSDALHALWPME